MRPFELTHGLLLAALCGAVALAACSTTIGEQQCRDYHCEGMTDGQSSGGGGGASSGAGAEAPAARTAEDVAKELYVQLHPDLSAKCGGCHAQPPDQNGGAGPSFMFGSDALAARLQLIAHGDIVIADVGSSKLLTKGPHTGSSLDSFPELSSKVIEWLRWEALSLDERTLPRTTPVALVEGDNALSLDELGGPAGSKLLFSFTKLEQGGGRFALRITNARIENRGAEPLHLVRPRLYVVHPDGSEWLDAADTFGDLDQHFQPARAEAPAANQEAFDGQTALIPSNSIYISPGWSPWQGDYKLMIEAELAEVGAAPDQVEMANPGCQNLNGRFNETVLPVLRGMGVGSPRQCNSNNCHGGVRAPNMAAGLSEEELCRSLRTYVDRDDRLDTPPAQLRSRIFRPTVSGHGGDLVANPEAYRQFWLNLINAQDGNFFF